MLGRGNNEISWNKIMMIFNNLYIIVLVTYVTVKGQATRKKPWQQSKTTPTIFANGKVKREEKSLRELR